MIGDKRFIAVVLEGVGFIAAIIVIELIKLVLNIPKADLMGIKKNFWGRGTSISGVGFLRLWKREQVFLYSRLAQSSQEFELIRSLLWPHKTCTQALIIV